MCLQMIHWRGRFVARYSVAPYAMEKNDVNIRISCQRTFELHGPCRHNPCSSARWDHRWVGWKIWGLKKTKKLKYYVGNENGHKRLIHRHRHRYTANQPAWQQASQPATHTHTDTHTHTHTHRHTHTHTKTRARTHTHILHKRKKQNEGKRQQTRKTQNKSERAI